MVRRAGHVGPAKPLGVGLDIRQNTQVVRPSHWIQGAWLLIWLSGILPAGQKSLVTGCAPAL